MSKDAQEYDRDAALANLTDEERAALEDDDLSPEEKAALEDIAGDDEGDDDEDDEDIDADDEGTEDDGEEDAEEKKAAAPAKKSEEAKVDESAETTEADDGDDDEDLEEVNSRYQVKLPDDFDDQVKALDDREAELAKKFKAGEIEADEFLSENKSLASEREKLGRIATKAEIAQEMKEQNAAQTWQRKVRALMRDAKASDGIDYSKPLLGAALDKALKDLAAKDENNDKPMSWFLKEAHKQVKTELGVGKKEVTKEDKPTEKPKARKPDTSKLPASLANVPGGDGPGDVGDEFADLDKLDGLAYETALAKMTPAQRDRYLATA
jgi:hypothetical protein